MPRTLPPAVPIGAEEPALPHAVTGAFDFVEAGAILLLLDNSGVCCSSGSACTTGSLDPSHVLSAMGLSPMRARGSVRFSLGLYNTAEEVDYLLKHLPGIIKRLRDISEWRPQTGDALTKLELPAGVEVEIRTLGK